MRRSILLLCVLLELVIGLTSAIKFPIKPIDNDDFNLYKVGTGIADITGPAAEIGMMGYAMMNQKTSGIHNRLQARAFVFGKGDSRIVFVSTHSCMIFDGVKDAVINKLQQYFGSSIYTHDNVMLSGEHTHSGPAGYSYYLIYNLVSFGFVQDNFDVIVNGITQAIIEAHNNVVDGVTITMNSGDLIGSNINRSPSSYLANPASERAQYQYDTDTLMTVLRMENASAEIGMVSWFSVHGTSMNNTNTLISADNKGYASYLFEKLKNGNDSLPASGPFVAAFAQSNEGDVSPNTAGAFCPDGTPCGDGPSTCNGHSQGCIGRGPGKDMYESTTIIGKNQFDFAQQLYQGAKTPIQGGISYIHTYVNMTNVAVGAEWTSTGQNETTCPAALGDSFAAGTTDGCGDFDFTQGANSSSVNPYWNFLSYFVLSTPTPEQLKCQSPKPILLNTGFLNFPSAWTPSVVPLQILQLGQLFIVGVPGEFTTMSGRRLRASVLATIQENTKIENPVVVIAGLSNSYTHYIATYEEYQNQRYEAASTIFGPHTLAAYQQEFSKLAAALVTNTPVPPGPSPPDLTSATYTFLPPVILDSAPSGKHFGSVKQDAKSTYKRGDTIEVQFWGAHPRNKPYPDTFLTIEAKDSTGSWTVVRNDGDWDTYFEWERHGVSESVVTITWETSGDTPAGTYRIGVFGTSKDIWGDCTPYNGYSKTFQLV